MMSDDIIMRNIALGGENDGLCVREVKVVRLWGQGGLQDTLKYGDFTPKTCVFQVKSVFLDIFQICQETKFSFE